MLVNSTPLIAIETVSAGNSLSLTSPFCCSSYGLNTYFAGFLAHSAHRGVPRKFGDRPWQVFVKSVTPLLLDFTVFGCILVSVTIV
jgi:hypothetical protein